MSKAGLVFDYEEAQRIFRYDPKTGMLFWRFLEGRGIDATATKRSPTRTSGRVFYEGLSCPAAKVIWLLHHKVWPERPLRRINKMPWDDRIENLAIFGHERGKGITFRGKHGWQAFSGSSYTRKYLGAYDTPEEALAAREAYDKGLDMF